MTANTAIHAITTIIPRIKKAGIEAMTHFTISVTIEPNGISKSTMATRMGRVERRAAPDCAGLAVEDSGDGVFGMGGGSVGDGVAGMG